MATALATTIVNGAQIQASDTWDPASIANGASLTLAMANVTGAALGDFVIASFSLTIAGMVLSAEVSAANTVAVTLINNTGGAVDLGSGTITVRVLKAE